MKKGVTLIEILATVMIISIIVLLALPSFSKMQEASLDKEAFGTLKRMQEAVRLYNMEFDQYYPSSGTVSDIPTINRNLKLSLSTAADPSWNYSLKYVAAGSGINCSIEGTCVQAVRNGSDGRTWRLEICENVDTATSGACP
jgi:prepilin-type N-terminal cleavage/methylation domain-containing protein